MDHEHDEVVQLRPIKLKVLGRMFPQVTTGIEQPLIFIGCEPGSRVLLASNGGERRYVIQNAITFRLFSSPFGSEPHTSLGSIVRDRVRPSVHR